MRRAAAIAGLAPGLMAAGCHGTRRAVVVALVSLPDETDELQVSLDVEGRLPIASRGATRTARSTPVP